MRSAPAAASVVEAWTAGPEETRALGRALAGVLRPGDVVLVSGDLGAGKTVLAQGLAAGLGVSEAVTSPTFTLVRPLPCRPGAGAGGAGTRAGGTTAGAGGADAPGAIRTMLHADLYRLEHVHEVVDLGLGELVEDGAVAVVEWGEAADPVLGRDALAVRLQPDDTDETRLLAFTATGPWAARAGALADVLAPWARPAGPRAR